ncbi:hypothetical protein ACFYQA_24745 [Streptomyces sp. NPDC005774]|uniref:hypothetical protein n=1 Tax=Streptomyces sp. NPDC005774 TaxID=3364728 RepID=UPI003684FB75
MPGTADPPDWTKPGGIRWSLTELGARSPVVPPLTARLRATAADDAPGWPSAHFTEIVNDLTDHAQVILYSQFWRVDASRAYGVSGTGLDRELDWTAPWLFVSTCLGSSARSSFGSDSRSTAGPVMG